MKRAIGLMAARILLLNRVPHIGANTVVLGGNSFGNQFLLQGLNDLGTTFVNQTGTDGPSSAGLGAGDAIILGLDGGTGPFADYTSFLNSGGKVVITGGSDYDPYRSWVSGYLNITDTASGWQTDGGWQKVANDPAYSYVPSSYTFQNIDASYHMLGFSPTPNTNLVGMNGEGDYVAAVRSYPNGGSLNYLALDIGAYSGGSSDQAFVDNWLHGALNPVVTPEPSTLALLSAGALGLLGYVWRRRRS